MMHLSDENEECFNQKKEIKKSADPAKKVVMI
jgi:hypothetical protein